MTFKTEKYILNFFFGKVLSKPISFQFTFKNLRDINKVTVTIYFNLKNNESIFLMEEEFKKFNSIEEKQQIGHNTHAAAHTGLIEAIYPKYQLKDSYIFSETVNVFLQNFIAYLLTFFQRRRVIVGILDFSYSKERMSFPPFLAGENVDSIGYGEPLISYDNTNVCLSRSIETYVKCNTSQTEIIEGLLIRYNETLNLPYSYERSEAYWRIIESLGNESLNSSQKKEYERLKKYIGIKKQSGNLKKVISTLINHQIEYSDNNIKDAFNFRNTSTHEYLNIKKISSSQDPFVFLNQCVELIILSKLNIETKYYMKQSLLIVQNRVL